jgi:2-polyprenyl-3-methyl-5-hydroxy-6-metoxy-1,4-benzoquinol methylase
MELITHTSCRLCRSPKLLPVVDLGQQYLQGLFIKKCLPAPPKKRFPLSLILCQTCGLLQLQHTVSPKTLFSTYWYRSGTNATMRHHLKNIVEEAADIIKRKKANVLDIGCNDGTLLHYYPSVFKKVGIDPSNAIDEIKEKATLIKDTFPTNKLGSKKFDIITSIAMFYDIEEPVGFVNSLKKILAADGLWIFEVYYMPSLLLQHAYDMICHEHLAYYRLSVIEYLLKKTRMKLIKINQNNINGATIRCYVTHKENQAFNKIEDQQAIAQLKKFEENLKLASPSVYKKFGQLALNHRRQLRFLLQRLKRKGKKIHIYGASTKGNTLLQFCGIDKSIIDFAADRNPQKWGAKTPGTNIPIISEGQSRMMKPDYYLVLPWAFREEFLKRERKTIEDGTALIFPFPKIEIVKN